jgi:hypothetical protein
VGAHHVRILEILASGPAWSGTRTQTTTPPIAPTVSAHHLPALERRGLVRVERFAASKRLVSITGRGRKFLVWHRGQVAG